MNEKKSFIKEYITENECDYMCDGIIFDCDYCTCFKDSYLEACIRCNGELANAVSFGGYDTEETFWEQI